MTEKYDSRFHKWYVSGIDGVVLDVPHIVRESAAPKAYGGMSYEDVLQDYRRYIKDPQANLPEVIEEELRALGIKKAS